jgi:hypothetical protein
MILIFQQRGLESYAENQPALQVISNKVHNDCTLVERSALQPEAII